MKMDSLAAVQLLRAYEMDTSKSDLLSEAALSYNKIKTYDKAAQIYIKKIDLKKGTSMDYYNLGKTYYNLQDFVKSDSVLAIFNEQQPAYVQGYVWRARAASNIDPDSKLGLAKPVYESIIEKTAVRYCEVCEGTRGSLLLPGIITTSCSTTRQRKRRMP